MIIVPGVKPKFKKIREAVLSVPEWLRKRGWHAVERPQTCTADITVSCFPYTIKQIPLACKPLGESPWRRQTDYGSPKCIFYELPGVRQFVV